MLKQREVDKVARRLVEAAEARHKGSLERWVLKAAKLACKWLGYQLQRCMNGNFDDLRILPTLESNCLAYEGLYCRGKLNLG